MVFINLDDVLVDLKLPPSVLEVPVPRFFIEDQQRALEEREKLLDVLMVQVDQPRAAAAAGERNVASAAARPSAHGSSQRSKSCAACGRVLTRVRR